MVGATCVSPAMRIGIYGTESDKISLEPVAYYEERRFIMPCYLLHSDPLK